MRDTDRHQKQKHTQHLHPAARSRPAGRDNSNKATETNSALNKYSSTLLNIINLSLSSGYISQSFKLIKPFLKQTLANLPFVSQILEKCVAISCVAFSEQ